MSGFCSSPSSKPLPIKFAEARVTGEGSQNHSFAEVLLSKPQSRIEVKEARDDSRNTGFNSKNRNKRKGQSSVCMELLQISFDEGGIGGEDARLAVNYSSFESPVMAAGSVHLRRKTKGNFRICGVLRVS